MIPGIVAAALSGASLPALAGALCRKSAGQTISTGFTGLTWQEEVYDVSGWHDVSSNTARMTVPAGVGIEAVRVTSNMRMSANTNHHTRHTKSVSGGAAAIFHGAARFHYINTTSGLAFGLANLNSAIVEVSDAESAYFQYEYAKSSGTDTPNNHGNTFCSIEAINPALRRVLVRKSGTQGIAAGVAEEITWDTEEYNIGSWTISAEDVTSPFTGRVRMTCNVNTNDSSNTLTINFFHNGVAVPGCASKRVGDLGAEWINAISAVIEVSAGDDLSVNVVAAAALDVNANEHTWFCVEEVPEDYVCVLLNRNSGTQTIPNSDTAVEWQNTVYEDESGLWDAGDPTKVIAPFNGYFRQTFGLISNAVSGQFAAWGDQDGAIYYGSPGETFAIGSAGYLNGMGAWAPCLAGDEIRLMARSATSRTIGTVGGIFMGVEFRPA